MWHRSASRAPLPVELCSCNVVSVGIWCHHYETQCNERCNLIRTWCHLLLSNTAALITSELDQSKSKQWGKFKVTGGRFNRLRAMSERRENCQLLIPVQTRTQDTSWVSFAQTFGLTAYTKTLWESFVFRILSQSFVPNSTSYNCDCSEKYHNSNFSFKNSESC